MVRIHVRDRQAIAEGLRDAALHFGDRFRDDVLIMPVRIAGPASGDGRGVKGRGGRVR